MQSAFTSEPWSSSKDGAIVKGTPMQLRGTPLNSGGAFDLASTILNAVPRDVSKESAQYWRAHTDQLRTLMREVMLTPGAYIIEIDRTLTLNGGEFFNDKSKERPILRQDERSSEILELDVSRLRIVSLKDCYEDIFGSRPRFIPVDDYIGLTLLTKQYVIPPQWRNKKNCWDHGAQLRFDGTWRRNPDSTNCSVGSMHWDDRGKLWRSSFRLSSISNSQIKADAADLSLVLLA